MTQPQLAKISAGEVIIEDAIAHLRRNLREALAAIDDADWPKVQAKVGSSLVGATCIREAIMFIEELKKESGA